MIHRNTPRLIMDYTWLPDEEDAEEVSGSAAISWAAPRQTYPELIDSAGDVYPPNLWTRSLPVPTGMPADFRGHTYNNGSWDYGLVSWSGRMRGRITGLLQIQGWLDDQDPATDVAHFDESWEMSHTSNETDVLPIRAIDLTAYPVTPVYVVWTVRFIPTHLRVRVGV
jgi:hypothetical protein